MARQRQAPPEDFTHRAQPRDTEGTISTLDRPELIHGVDRPEMIRPTNLKGGSKTLSPKSMKGKAMLGRNSNITSKMKFKTSAVARIDRNGGSTRARAKKKTK